MKFIKHEDLCTFLFAKFTIDLIENLYSIGGLHYESLGCLG